MSIGAVASQPFSGKKTEDPENNQSELKSLEQQKKRVEQGINSIKSNPKADKAEKEREKALTKQLESINKQIQTLKQTEGKATEEPKSTGQTSDSSFDKYIKSDGKMPSPNSINSLGKNESFRTRE